MSKRIVVIGHSDGIVKPLIGQLKQAGFDALGTIDIKQAITMLKREQFDLLVLGRAAYESAINPVRAALLQRNPKLRIIKSLAPILPLITEQVKAEFAVPDATLGKIDFSYRDNAFHLTTSSAVQAKVVFYRLNLLWQSRVRTVYDSHTSEGTTAIPLPRKWLGIGGENFAVLTINDSSKYIIKIG